MQGKTSVRAEAVRSERSSGGVCVLCTASPLEGDHRQASVAIPTQVRCETFPQLLLF